MIIGHRAIFEPPSTALPGAAGPAVGAEGGAKPAIGFPERDTFDSSGKPRDPVAGAAKQLDQQAAGRAGLVDGQFQIMDGLMATNNRAWSWHKLMMELISLMKPG